MTHPQALGSEGCQTPLRPQLSIWRLIGVNSQQNPLVSFILGSDPMAIAEWRSELPTLNSRLVVLREPLAQDLGPIVDLLAISDACRFGLDEPVADVAVMSLLERATKERAAGTAFTFTILLA